MRVYKMVHYQLAELQIWKQKYPRNRCQEFIIKVIPAFCSEKYRYSYHVELILLQTLLIALSIKVKNG